MKNEHQGVKNSTEKREHPALSPDSVPPQHQEHGLQHHGDHHQVGAVPVGVPGIGEWQEC